jgi:CheY-like chemotaxis protein
VEDSGPGIPKEKEHELFKKFQGSLGSLGQGTGLGLYVCRELTNLLEGQFFFDDSFNSGIPGQPGARFVVDLLKPPCEMYNDLVDETEHDDRLSDGKGLVSEGVQAIVTPSSPKKQKLSVPIPTTSLKPELPEKLAVLFVDDDFVLRKLFSRSLRKAQPGWKVRECSSGEAALLMSEKETFDIIFMDQYMASVERALLGTDTVRALRANGVKCRICGLSANDLSDQFLERYVGILYS